MPDLQVTSTIGRVVEETAIQQLKASLRGELFRRGDDNCDEIRKVWNGMINKHPAMIVQCAGVADVINAVNFARTHKLLVAVRGGGHNVAGHAICDGGIVIDLSRMKSVRIDPLRRTARAEGGVTWGEFDHEAQVFGLANTGVDFPAVGIAGLTLGGGFGWLVRKYGLACDNLLCVDIVTADGRFLTASANENEDLFWGVRGGGGNFGIVTSFEYRLHPVGQLLAGTILYPLAKAKEVLKFYHKYTSTAPDELTAWAVLLTTPEGTPAIEIFVCYDGPSEAGQQAVRPLREFSPPLEDHIGPKSYREVQTLFEYPSGQQNYWKSNFMKGFSDDAIDTIVDHFARVTSPQSEVFIEHLDGAVSRVREDETAFNHRDAKYSFLILSMWSYPDESERHISWTDEFWEAMQLFSSGGVYVNYLGEEGEERVRAAYGPNYDRLVALKNKYDPANLFRHNQNIKPTV